MLVNPKFQSRPFLGSLLDLSLPKKIVDGVYSVFNGTLYLPRSQSRPFEYQYSDLGPGGSSYGVCDNWEQIIEQAPNLLTCPEKLAIFLGEVVRKDQPPEGGWRWHKWGLYIGTKNPQCEYLYDEEGIEKVYCYHIVRLFDDEIE